MLANMVNTRNYHGDVIIFYATAYTCLSRPAWLAAVCWAAIFGAPGCQRGLRYPQCRVRQPLELVASDFERFGSGSMITRSLNDINVIQQAILQTIQLVLPVPFWLWRASSSPGLSIRHGHASWA